MSKKIWVPDEMIEVLESLRNNVDYLTYGAMKNLSYTDLFRILAHKIKEKKIVMAVGTIDTK